MAIDLLGQANIRIVGAAESDRIGWAVARAGDVNGDGRADVIIGAPFAGNNGRDESGSAYVVFGRRSTTTIDLASLGEGGFRIDGAAEGDSAGTTVAGGGDFNGDGRADVIVGAPEADNNERTQSGSAYVVYGQRSAATVDLATLGTRGFRIDGAASGDWTGWSVANAGDVNGDGKVDILVGAPKAANVPPEEFEPVYPSGSVYAVFGQASSGAIDLATLGTRGFRIDAPQLLSGAGWSVAGAGDVNGDGKADVIVGAPFTSDNERLFSGSVYVVFGRSATGTVNLASLGEQGFQISGDVAGDDVFGGVGWSVSGAGDVNGDGRGDVLIGSPLADANGRLNSGSAYVVFGQASTGAVDLAALGSRGFRIDGAAEGDVTGGSVASQGDINGGGRADVIVSAEQADQNGRSDSGSVYVVYGERTPAPVDLAALSEGGGLRVDGAAADDLTGWSVSGAGDINGDKQPDLLVGAQAANSTDREHSGLAYVVFLQDKVAPALDVAARPLQRVLTTNAIAVRVSCDEDCTLFASGSIDTATRSTMLTPVSMKVPALAPRTVELRLSAAAQRRLGTLLRGGKRARATVTLRAVDAAANTSTAKRTIGVRQ